MNEDQSSDCCLVLLRAPRLSFSTSRYFFFFFCANKGGCVRLSSTYSSPHEALSCSGLLLSVENKFQSPSQPSQPAGGDVRLYLFHEEENFPHILAALVIDEINKRTPKKKSICNYFPMACLSRVRRTPSISLVAFSYFFFSFGTRVIHLLPPWSLKNASP